MAFPTTGILDNFAYANGLLASVSGGAWATPVGLDFNVSAGVLFPVSGAGAVVLWQAATYTNAEAYITVSPLPGTGEGASLAWLDGSGNGYVGSYIQGTGIRISRTTGYAGTTLGADVALTLSAGDQLGMFISGGVIEVYTATGGVWTLRSSRSDATYTTARRIGLTATGTTLGLDAFGGGEAVVGASGWGMLLDSQRNRLVMA